MHRSFTLLGPADIPRVVLTMMCRCRHATDDCSFTRIVGLMGIATHAVCEQHYG